MESLIALTVLLLIALFIILKTVYENKLIHKAADALGIPYKYRLFFRVDLLSIYKHIPVLKENSVYGYTLKQWIISRDSSHYQCIMNKLEGLKQREEEYGETFLMEDYYRHAF